jgi:DNA-directed RNA polymerase subunit RPC12/RpoP
MDWICSECGCRAKLVIPDSRAVACRYCGTVFLGTEKVGTLKDWAKDLYEAGKKKDGNRESV